METTVETAVQLVKVDYTQRPSQVISDTERIIHGPSNFKFIEQSRNCIIQNPKQRHYTKVERRVVLFPIDISQLRRGILESWQITQFCKNRRNHLELVDPYTLITLNCKEKQLAAEFPNITRWWACDRWCHMLFFERGGERFVQWDVKRKVEIDSRIKRIWIAGVKPT